VEIRSTLLEKRGHRRPAAPLPGRTPAPRRRTADELLGEALRAEIRRVFRGSMKLRHVDCGSCNGCESELQALLNSFHDLQRFGIDFVASPRHADALMVTGPPALHLEEALRLTDEATPRPRLVVAVGDCACSGGFCAGSPPRVGECTRSCRWMRISAARRGPRNVRTSKVPG
jgi:Ni,Fe-hydrogenase III small subunit